MDETRLKIFNSDRIESRQIDELIGLARGLLADGKINQDEIKYLEKWLAANCDVIEQPLIRTLYDRVQEVLADGIADEEEIAEIFETLSRFSNHDFELGETLKATTLPLCHPAPKLTFYDQIYCFTGSFVFGSRRDCEQAVIDRGANAGKLNKKTNVLVIGTYASENWKHSSFGNKIISACEYRDRGMPISIVSEEHWTSFL
jgi:NAD-dependent DNA ligase